jgi:hypothetical protein
MILIGVFLVFFESSIGPVLWIYGSQISTAKGMSIILMTNWIGSAFIGFAVPYLILPEALNLFGTFWLFAASMFALIFFVWFYVPETKGLDQIQIRRKFLRSDSL